MPSGAFSAGYDDSYLFGDFVCDNIFDLTLSPTGDGYTHAEFAGELGPGSPIVLDVGPDGTGGEARITQTAN